MQTRSLIHFAVILCTVCCQANVSMHDIRVLAVCGHSCTYIAYISFVINPCVAWWVHRSDTWHRILFIYLSMFCSLMAAVRTTSSLPNFSPSTSLCPRFARLMLCTHCVRRCMLRPGCTRNGALCSSCICMYIYCCGSHLYNLMINEQLAERMR